MESTSDHLVATLDALRTDLLLSKGASALTDTHALAERIRMCASMLGSVSQVEALAAAQEVQLHTSSCTALLRRAAIDDPDEEAGLAAATSELINILSGSGEHVVSFSTASVSLRMKYRQQATGTHGRIWRSEHIVAGACEERWGGLEVAGKCVVELGCGTAAAGLVCASLGARHVYLTDVDEGSLSLAKANAALNGLESVCTVQHLNVMDLEDKGPPLPAEERVDVVLASDIPYDFVDAKLLVESLAILLASPGGGGGGGGGGQDDREVAVQGEAMALVVQDCDPRRSEAHQAGIRQCIELAAKHPRLRLVHSEERQVGATSSTQDDQDDGVEEDGMKVVMHLYAGA